MAGRMNLRNYESLTGRNPWNEIQYRVIANHISVVTPEQEDILHWHIHKMLKKDRKSEERILAKAALTMMLYNPAKTYLVHGITPELINYASLSAPHIDKYAKNVRFEKVCNAIKEETLASPAAISLSTESVKGALSDFGEKINESIEGMRIEFMSNQEAVAAYIS